MHCLLFALAMLLGAPLAEETAAGLDPPTNARWQTLPVEVQNVPVGPDGRMWYQLRQGNSGDDSLAAVKENIAQEFQKAAPRIRGAIIVLFEASGRVWFCPQDKSVLLGYDGKTWIEHVIADRENSVCGECMSRGELTLGHANRSVGNQCWFITGRGVLSFDGTNWSRENCFDFREDWSSRSLTVSPDGKTAVAYSYSLKGFRVWRAGQWKLLALPPLNTPNPVTSLGLSDARTLWFVRREGRLERLNVGEDTDKPNPAAEEIARRVEVVRRIYQDAAGRMYMLAESIRDDKSSPPSSGLAVVVDGKLEKVVFNRQLTVQRDHHVVQESMPHLCADSRKIWWPLCGPGPAARLLDLDRGDLTVTLPLSSPTWIRAVGTDGRVYLAENGSQFIYNTGIRVFDPGIADDRVPLKVESTAVSSRTLAVAEDGSIWIAQKGPTLVRFDGKTWNPLSSQADENPNRSSSEIHAIVPGQGGRVLVRTATRDTIYEGNKELASGRISDMVEDNPDMIRQTFPPDRSPTCKTTYGTALAMTADKAGNIWYLENNRLLVFVRDHWLLASEPLTDAGSRRGSIQFMSPVGDGSKIYVSDLAMYHDGGCSFLSQVKNGELTFTKAPHVTLLEESVRVLRAREGTLWLPLRIGGGNGTSDYYNGQIACQITDTGIDESLRNTGWAHLIDQAGNVWLGEIQGASTDLFRIWRQGKVVQELMIPQSTSGLLFSDRPGSVFVHTSTGLHHYTSESPDYHPFRLAKSYSLDEAAGRPIVQAYSKLGYLVLLVQGKGPSGSQTLHLVHLPK